MAPVVVQPAVPIKSFPADSRGGVVFEATQKYVCSTGERMSSSKASDKKRIPSAGENYTVESSVKWVKSGHHDTGTERNEGLPHPDKAYLRSQREEEYVQPPEYSENIGTGYGARTKIKVEAPASKPNNSNPQGARPDSNPDWGFSRGTSGASHPKSKPETAKPGAGPRHPDHKIVTSTPNGGPRQAKSGGKPKDSTNTNDSVSYGKGYGDRSPVGNPTVKKRSDVVPPDSSMIHPDNNPKRRESAYAGVGRESLKDVKKLSNRGSA